MTVFLNRIFDILYYYNKFKKKSKFILFLQHFSCLTSLYYTNIHIILVKICANFGQYNNFGILSFIIRNRKLFVLIILF
jgi:hypothetical protein